MFTDWYLAPQHGAIVVRLVACCNGRTTVCIKLIARLQDPLQRNVSITITRPSLVFQPYITCPCRNGIHHTGCRRLHSSTSFRISSRTSSRISYLKTHTNVVYPAMTRRVILILLPHRGRYVRHELRKTRLRTSIPRLADLDDHCVPHELYLLA